MKLFKLIAVASLLTGGVFADSAEQMGYASTGTAFKFVSATNPAVTSASSVVTWTSATTPNATTYRMGCNVDVYLNNFTPSTTTPTVTSATGIYWPAYSVEYFVLGPRTNIAIAAASTSGNCSIARTGR